MNTKSPSKCRENQACLKTKKKKKTTIVAMPVTFVTK